MRCTTLYHQLAYWFQMGPWVYGPRPGVEKEAHDAYRVGLNAQTSGDLQTAVRSRLGRRRNVKWCEICPCSWYMKVSYERVLWRCFPLLLAAELKFCQKRRCCEMRSKSLELAKRGTDSYSQDFLGLVLFPLDLTHVSLCLVEAVSVVSQGMFQKHRFQEFDLVLRLLSRSTFLSTSVGRLEIHHHINAKPCFEPLWQVKE